jgi:hypothetical protein
MLCTTEWRCKFFGTERFDHCIHMVRDVVRQSTQKAIFRKLSYAVSYATMISGVSVLLMGAYSQNKSLLLCGCCTVLFGCCCVGMLTNPREHEDCAYCEYRDHDFVYYAVVNEES